MALFILSIYKSDTYENICSENIILDRSIYSDIQELKPNQLYYDSSGDCTTTTPIGYYSDGAYVRLWNDTILTSPVLCS